MTFSPELEAKFDKLMGCYPPGRQRAALIPMLMFAQDEIGSITPELVAEVASRLSLEPLQVEEVVSYYSMLHRKPVGKHHIQICTNISCLLNGGEELCEHACEEARHRPQGSHRRRRVLAGRGGVHGRLLLGAGHSGGLRVSSSHDPREARPADRQPEEEATDAMLYNEPSPLEVKVLTRRFGLADSASLDTYLAHEGYQGFRKALEMKPEEIIDEVKASNLRGRGGAGFPTGMKWSFVPRNSPKPKYIVVNARRKRAGHLQGPRADRERSAPVDRRHADRRTGGGRARRLHLHSRRVPLPDRHHGPRHRRGVRARLSGQEHSGQRVRLRSSTRTPARASYECGEESALLESLEGKRGVPRIRPPFPAVAGAFQCPTVLNNVETFCAVPDILREGGAAFAALGTPKNGGTRLFCLSGHVNSPGVYELPMGFNLLRMIEEVAGGVRNGKKLKAVIPGGSSCPVLKAEECDLAMDYDSLAKAGSMLGSGGVVVMDEDTCMVKAAARIMRFYAHESCGWCIPCREGTTWLSKLLARFHDGAGERQEIDLIGELARNMLGRTFCPLGDAAAMPTIAFVEKFRDEFEEHLDGRPCPFEGSQRLVTA